jgi:hypothetical protein
MEVAAFENKYFFLEIRNNILFVEYKDNLIMTLPVAQEMVNKRLEFQRQNNYSLISMIAKLNIKYLNKEAREYLAVEGIKGLNAAAFITNSMVSRILLKIFFAVEKPPIPVAVFENEKSAVAWIKKLAIE